MERLHSSELQQFARRYRFVGGRLRGVTLRHRRGATEITAALLVRPAPRDLGVPPAPVKLIFRMIGVEEFRFQKRPSTAAGRISDLKFGYFNGLYYINFDAWGLPAGEVPGLHDFRASDAFVAGNDLFWKVVESRE